MTSPFGDKTDVIPNHWKTHVAEERSDIESELDCSGLAYFEEWHYSVFDSSGICHLGIISKDSVLASAETNEKININLNVLSDFESDTFVTRTSNLYTPFIYQSFGSTKNTEHCSIHCYFDSNDHCDFHFLYNGYCYLGNFNTETPVGTTSGSHEIYIYKGKKCHMIWRYIL